MRNYSFLYLGKKKIWHQNIFHLKTRTQHFLGRTASEEEKLNFAKLQVKFFFSQIKRIIRRWTDPGCRILFNDWSKNWPILGNSWS